MKLIRIFTATMMLTVISFWALGAVAIFSSEIGLNKTVNSETQVIKLKISGMHCGGCCSNISGTLMKTEGILSNELEWPGDVATIEFDPSVISEKDIIKIIKKLGFKAKVFEEEG